jgi:hypothetical protein
VRHSLSFERTHNEFSAVLRFSIRFIIHMRVGLLMGRFRISEFTGRVLAEICFEKSFCVRRREMKVRRRLPAPPRLAKPRYPLLFSA